MGSLTRSAIILQGLRKVGRTDLTDRAIEALRAWLRSREKDWPFPYLRQSREGLSLPAGTTALKIGAGEGGITNEIQRVLNPIWIYDSSYGIRSNCLISSLDSTDIDGENRINSSVSTRGLPVSFKVRTAISASGIICRQLIPTPVPDRAYLLAFDYIELETDPIPLTTTIPRYPNDATMIQFVKSFALEWANGEDAPDVMAANEKLSSMVAGDRIKDGQEPGTNDSVGMDPGVYR